MAKPPKSAVAGPDGGQRALKVRVKSAKKRTVASRAIGQGLAKIEPSSPNLLIAYSAKAGSTAADGDGRNSPFTSALSRPFRGAERGRPPADAVRDLLLVIDRITAQDTGSFVAYDGQRLPW